MHKYTVELRIEGGSLLPESVTQKLGLQPCQVRVAVEMPEKKSRKALWAFDGISDELGTKHEWDSLEEGLLYTLQKISAKRREIFSSFDEFEIYWWCGHFQQSFDGGPSFSPSLLKSLADFGAPLYLDNYFSDGDEEPA